ncbi:MAG: VacB/RNase II family 3'-5' exoribonuclease [Deltaproteobacteria bacterium]|nr:VacB/RNase II family 3'-5' exoribonuclease [Deltaproteobacteria bacterium]
MPTPRKPTREGILDVLAAEPRALHAREIAARLGIREADYLDLLGVLEELTFDGALRALPGQRFKVSPTAPAETREGFIHVHPRGFGFLSTPGQSEDVFVPGASLGGAMHGDRVRVRVLSRSRRGLEGSVAEVLVRANTRIQGVLRKRGKSAWLEVDDGRIRGPIVLPRDTAGEDGDAAVVEVTRFPETPDENPEARLLECLGPPGDPVVETRKVLLREEIEEGFPDAVEAEARDTAIAVASLQLGSREDLRELRLVTIDPDDARDHDDAIWVERSGSGFEVCVAIADVAEYVREDGALDLEARRRGFSIYLPNRAIPMLPPTLSSNACSLVEGEDRLCVAMRMQLDGAGKVRSSSLCEAVMRSRAKLTYSGVARALRWSDDASITATVPEELIGCIDTADQLARILRKRRLRRGSLELNVPEARIVLDPGDGSPIDVKRRAQDPGVRRAYQLIEELMLLANEAVALWMQKRELQPVYRVHPPPDEAKLTRLANLCAALDIEFELDDATDPKRLGAFLLRVSEHPLAEIIGMFSLRSLKQASYDLVNVGHFGLALQSYLHFTSPIRRYPDLLVHRALKTALRAQPGAHAAEPDWLKESVEHCNGRERKVMEIEREIADLYRAVFMRSQIGLIAEGRVMEILPSSVIVALDDPFVDVRVSDEMLGDDAYEATDDGLMMVGKRSGDTVRLGDRMKIRVEDVNLARRSVLGRRIRVETGKRRGEKQSRSRREKAPAPSRKRSKSKKKSR